MTSVQHASVVSVSLPPGPFSTAELYLSSILVPYHPIPVSRCASHLNPGPISTPSRSRDLCFLSTQAPIFTFLLCLRWILLQSGSWYLHLAYIQVTSHLHPGPPNCILVPSKHYLKCIHISRCVSHLHPGPLSTGELYLSSIPVPCHPIHVSRCASQLNPGPISTPSRTRDLCLLSTQALRFTFLLCLSWILPQSGSWYLHLAYIQITSRPFLNWRIVSQLHPSPISPYPRLMMCISTQSRPHLNPIQVPRFVSPLKPGSHIRVSSLSQLTLTSIWLLTFASRLHPGNISPPARSTKLHLSSI